MFFCHAYMGKTFPMLLYIICASDAKHSFAAIFFCVSLWTMAFCSGRKLPSKVLSDSENHQKFILSNIIKKTILYM